MRFFDYQAPTTLDQAVNLLGNRDDAKILAGGTDLLVKIRLGLLQPGLLVDIKAIPELSAIHFDTSGLVLGAAVPGYRISAREDISAVYPGLVEAVDLIGSTQVQGRCSAGGNLCNASPAADTVPALMVNRGECLIRGRAGERRVAVEDFATGPGQNCLAADEILVSLKFPYPEHRSSDAYLRFIPRTEMDIAAAGAAVSLTLDEAGVCTRARVAIGAVAPTALLVPKAADALVGTLLDEPALARCADAVSEVAVPITDRRGTAAFRTQVVGVLARRAALQAKQRVLQPGDNQLANNQQAN